MLDKDDALRKALSPTPQHVMFHKMTGVKGWSNPVLKLSAITWHRYCWYLVDSAV